MSVLNLTPLVAISCYESPWLLVAPRFTWYWQCSVNLRKSKLWKQASKAAGIEPLNSCFINCQPYNSASVLPSNRTKSALWSGINFFKSMSEISFWASTQNVVRCVDSAEAKTKMSKTTKSVTSTTSTTRWLQIRFQNCRWRRSRDGNSSREKLKWLFIPTTST